MKAVVIGLGSMGKRRIRLLKKRDEAAEIFGVDSREDRQKEAEELYQIKMCNTLEEAVANGAECAFICTSPLTHGCIISKCLQAGLHVFTEINLVADMYEENMEMAREKGCVLFLSSTFLYRDEINYIKNEVKKAASTLTYSYHIGQYLPDWHPWENYTEYFIGDSRTNGCREIMAIEFPWIYKTFGRIIDVNVRKGKKTMLKTTYDDSYLLSVEHENGTQGVILVDVVSRKAVRNLEIFGEDLYLSWDGSARGLQRYNIDKHELQSIDLYEQVDSQKGYADFVVENAYMNEIEAFFDEIQQGVKPCYGFAEDREVLEMIGRIGA